MTAGIRRRTLASGSALMQMVVTLDGGSRLPTHEHVHEQISYLVSGRVRFTLGDGRETRELGAGESICLASHLPHGVEALETTVIVDTFSPPREDLLAQDRASMPADA